MNNYGNHLVHKKIKLFIYVFFLCMTHQSLNISIIKIPVYIYGQEIKINIKFCQV